MAIVSWPQIPWRHVTLCITAPDSQKRRTQRRRVALMMRRILVFYSGLSCRRQVKALSRWRQRNRDTQQEQERRRVFLKPLSPRDAAKMAA